MLFASLLWLIFIGAIVWVIVYFARRKKQTGGQKLTLEDYKKAGVGIVIAVLGAFFIGFAAASVVPELRSTTAFAIMLILSVFFIIGGVAIMKRQIISWGLIMAGVFAFIYNLGLNMSLLNAATKAVLTGIALAALIFVAFKKLQDKPNSIEKEVK
jgi:MFS family permease